MTPAEQKVIKVAVDVSEVGHNIGFEQLPSVVIHELYEAVEEMKREARMEDTSMSSGASRRYENDPHKGSPPSPSLSGLPGGMSTAERARRFKFAIAEYARFHRELIRQQDDLDKASKNVMRLEADTLNARNVVIGLIGNTAYLDFMEELHWRYVEHGWNEE